MKLKTNNETLAALRWMIEHGADTKVPETAAQLHDVADQIGQELARRAAAAAKRLTLGEVDAMLRMVEAADANLLDANGTDRRTLKGKLEQFRVVTLARQQSADDGGGL